jgi:hypothetical protein
VDQAIAAFEAAEAAYRAAGNALIAALEAAEAPADPPPDPPADPPPDPPADPPPDPPPDPPMALTTAQNYIYQALRKCGQLRPGYTASPELLADALSEWQMLFDSWAAERTMGFSIPTYVYPVTGPGSQSGGNGYQLGPTAADWVGPRPESIVRANLKMTSVGPQPVYLPIRMLSAEDWASLAIRQIPGINVTNLAYWDPQFPNGVFNVFPPLTGNAIELFCWQGFAAPATLATAYSAPAGYMDAVILSLADRLLPMCTKDVVIRPVNPIKLAGMAHAAREKVRLVNRPIPTLKSDFRGGSKPSGYYDPNVSWTGEPM